MELSTGVHVVKLHGDASQAEGIVLCRDDYDEFFDRRPAMALLLEGLLLNQTFFFVGYGLRDPNFRQVYSRIVRMLRDARKPAFATSFEIGGRRGAISSPDSGGRSNCTWLASPERRPTSRRDTCSDSWTASPTA